MGDWRTVTIVGTISPEDVPAARVFIEIGADPKGWDRFHCLCYTSMSLCGLGRWIPEGGGAFTAVGNLSERNYAVEDVAETLRGLLVVAPSLAVKVHCGGSYESTDCIATVSGAWGSVHIGPPEIEVVGEGLQQLADQRIRAYMAGLEAA